MEKFFLFKRPLCWRVLPSGRSSPASLVVGALHFGEIEEKQSEQREFFFFIGYPSQLESRIGWVWKHPAELEKQDPQVKWKKLEDKEGG